MPYKLINSILQFSPTPVSVFDLQGRFLIVSDSYAIALGKTKDEIIGKTFADLFTPELVANFTQRLERLRQTQSVMNVEDVILIENTPHTFMTTLFPLFNASRQHFANCGIAVDITERKWAERELQNQLKRLEALREIDIAIVGTTNLSLTLKTVLEQVINTLSVDAADILLLNPHSNVLEFAAGRGFRNTKIEKTQLRLGQGYAGRAALEQKAVLIPDLTNLQEPFLRASLIEGENFIFFCAVPLIAQGNLIGTLEIFHRAPLNPNQNWMDFLDSLAGQASIAIENSRLFNDLKRSNMNLLFAYDTTIEGWSKALDLRDKETEGHTLRVTEMTVTLARNAGISESEIVHIRRGALLHDIGKMGVPDAILLKPDKLTDEEWLIMRKHPTFAYELLYPIEYLRPALSIPYSHHEKWDGTGYPQGLKGEQIPLPARLFAVVDVWDALSNDRPYRKAWSQELVAKHIHEQSGTHFDPQAVELFLQVLSRDEPKAG